MIIDLCCQLNLNIENLENIRSRRDFNRYEIKYPSNFILEELYPKLLVETVFFAEAYPINKKDVTSIIYDYLIEKKDYDTIEKYDLFPFEINENRRVSDTLIVNCQLFTVNYWNLKQSFKFPNGRWREMEKIGIDK